MTGFAEVAYKGVFTAASGLKVPATTKLPDGVDPVLRSWEYTIASAAATEAGSRERKKLLGECFAQTVWATSRRLSERESGGRIRRRSRWRSATTSF